MDRRDPGELFNEAVALMEKKKFDKQKEFVQEQTATQVHVLAGGNPRRS